MKDKKFNKKRPKSTFGKGHEEESVKSRNKSAKTKYKHMSHWLDDDDVSLYKKNEEEE